MSAQRRAALPSEQLRLLLTDEALSANLLPAMTDEERRALDYMGEAVVEDAQRWSLRSSLLDSKLLIPVTLINVVLSPHSSPEAVATRVRLSLWVYALDDLFEADSTEFDTLRRVVSECLSVSAGPLPAAGGAAALTEYGTLLRDICNNLAHHASWTASQPLWTGLLVRLLDGMLYEYWLQRRYAAGGCPDVVPPFDEYLFHATHSVGVPLIWGTSLATAPGAFASLPVARSLALLDKCGIVVRLANDLATPLTAYDGRTVDAIRLQAWTVQSRDPSVTHHEALTAGKATVSKLKEAALADLVRFMHGAPAAWGPESRLVRATQLVVDFYGEHDCRSWMLTSLTPALGSSPRRADSGGVVE